MRRPTLEPPHPERPQLHRNACDVTGQRFGRLTAHTPVGRKRGHVVWRCSCDCGGRKDVPQSMLRNGNVTTCGCVLTENARINAERMRGSRRGPGHSSHNLYPIWVGIKRRCYDERRDEYRNYGARGVYVCDRWLKGDARTHPFLLFVADMGERPTPRHTIDRIDADGPYAPDNCRWATPSEQARNRRPRAAQATGKDAHAPVV